MKASEGSPMKLVMALLVTICMLAGAGPALSQVAAIQARTLKARAIRQKPLRTAITSRVRTDVIVVKFREGTHVRERQGQFESNLDGVSAADDQLLLRGNLARQHIYQDLAQVNSTVAPGSGRYIRRVFSRPESELDSEKQGGESLGGEELADLNLYYYVLVANANARDTERLLDQLNALDVIEIAYPQPIPENAQADAAPTTGNLTASQGYANPAATGSSTTNGIDAAYARLFPGGRGNDVRIIDIEQGWNLTHEDMPPIFYQAGPNLGDWDKYQHGTAVLGVLAAAENNYGITGIAPQSRIGVSTSVDRTCIVPGLCWLTDNMENSINRSAAQLRYGDILVIEQHAPGPDSGGTAACNASQFEYVAMEYWDANFDAIKNATSNGIIVVEAAGNGSMDLDSSIYNGKFDRSVRDSGAILVGGGTSAGRAPECWTNFGSRVDLQGWGDSVATLGYGDLLKANGTDGNQYYTGVFSGTSSATPIVAGAVASLQGFRKARGLVAFNGSGMRDFLRQTGMPQAPATKQIGPLPNLRAAIDAHAPKRTLKITFLSVKIVDNVFTGPQTLQFNLSANSGSAVYPSGSGNTVSYPQGVSVNLPASLSFTAQEILNDGLTIFVSTNLRSVITFNPKTGAINSIWSRPVHVLHSFPQGTSYNSSPILAYGSRTFTDRSTDANGYFEITYRVEQQIVFTQ